MNECLQDQITECAGRFAVLETSLKAISDNTSKMASTLERVLDKHDGRITALEKWQSWVLGAAAVVGALFYGMFELAKR